MRGRAAEIAMPPLARTQLESGLAKMQKVFLTAAAVVAAVVVASAASAADRSRTSPAQSDWSGLYVGINGGGAFGNTDASETGLPADRPNASADYNLDHDLTGSLVGGTLGYNWQNNVWVAGFEADFDGADIDGTGRIDGTTVTQRNGAGGTAQNYVFASEKITSFGTARLRGGILVMPTTLVYATGGLAYGHVKYAGQFHYAPLVLYTNADSATKAGWTIGGGLEHRFTPSLSLKAEYLYYDLGDRALIADRTVSNPPFQSQFDYSTHGEIVRAGLNFKFGR
jgi:outer membrane immunogenic protein